MGNYNSYNNEGNDNGSGSSSGSNVNGGGSDNVNGGSSSDSIKERHYCPVCDNVMKTSVLLNKNLDEELIKKEFEMFESQISDFDSF